MSVPTSAVVPDTGIRALILRWRENPDATYQSWFLWPERLKNFRSIRRSIQQVIAEIEGNTFGTAYRGSSIETVVKSIAEQRQITKEGASTAAFEVEHTTSIYSGIVRLLDLAQGAAVSDTLPLFLVAPDKRQEEVREQLLRPAFRAATGQLRLRYLPYGELEKNREAMARFGQGLKAVDAIAKQLV